VQVDTCHFVLLTTDDKLLPDDVWGGMAKWSGNPIMVDVTSGHEALLMHPNAVVNGLTQIAAMLH